MDLRDSQRRFIVLKQVIEDAFQAGDLKLDRLLNAFDKAYEFGTNVGWNANTGVSQRIREVSMRAQTLTQEFQARTGKTPDEYEHGAILDQAERDYDNQRTEWP